MEATLELRLEQMTRRLERVERSARVMKMVCAIAFAALLPLASVVGTHAAASFLFLPQIAAQEFDLIGAKGKTTAKLFSQSGTPNLIFYDSKGKVVLGLGVNSTGAGIAVYDGNTLLAGTGVARDIWGMTVSGPSTGIGGATFDGNGVPRTVWGDAVDESASGISFLDSNGGLRSGVEYDPAVNFNGFYTQDGSGHDVSLVGNLVTASGILGANDSFMDLFDTSGQLRVFEFKNSTNEGGVAFSSTGTLQGAWGNP